MDTLLNEITTQAIFILNNLHFLRGDWFYAFIPLILFVFFCYRKRASDKNWHGVIDRQLLPFVLSKNKNKQRRYPLLLSFIATSLCITALAGPVYKKLPQPVYREQSSLIVLFDLSQSMNASDIKPSRLTRAKLELLDILKSRKAGQTALIVYAADAFVVTPLTDDNATIANLVPALDTTMMPAQGSNLSDALAKAYTLFTQTGVIHGNILVMTDGIHERDADAIEKIASQGHRLSIFGIGTDEGSPIPLAGGFLQDKNGAIVIPRLDTARLQKYALAGGGLYTSVRADDSDVNKLTRLFQSSQIRQPDAENKNALNADVWQEEGYWLILPLLFFAALWARKGWLAIALVFILPIPQPASADTPLLNTEHLWSSPDQQAMKAFNAGDNASAAEKFTRAEWKASAYYRNGDYEAAAKALEAVDDANGLYNRANALAKLGKYKEAIAAYDKAIKLDDHDADAKYNREQVKQLLEKQAQDKKDSDKDKPQQDKSEQDKNQDDQQQDKSQDQPQDKQKEQRQNKQNGSEQRDSEQKDSEQEDSGQASSGHQDADPDKAKEQDAEPKGSQQKDEEKKNADQKKTDPTAEQADGQPPEEKPEDTQSESDKNNDAKKAEEQQLKQRNAEKEKQQQQKEQQQYEQDQQIQQQQTERNDTIENREGEEKPAEVEINPVETEASITEKEKATEQWLKRIVDDPGGLLKRKFLYQYNQLPDQHNDNEPW